MSKRQKQYKEQDEGIEMGQPQDYKQNEYPQQPDEKPKKPVGLYIVIGILALFAIILIIVLIVQSSKDDDCDTPDAKECPDCKPPVQIQPLPYDVWQKQTVENGPSKRLAHCAVAINDTAMFLFGGVYKDGTTHKSLNDAYILVNETSKKDGKDVWAFKWTKVKYEDSDEKPDPRHMTSCSYVSKTKKIYMYGGFAEFNTFKGLKDFWEFDVEKLKWTQFNKQKDGKPDGEQTKGKDDKAENIPTESGSHGAVVYKDNLYIYGGYHVEGTTKTYSTKLFKYDPAKYEWEKLTLTNMPDKGRYGFGMTENDNSIYIFGGACELASAKKGQCNDMHKINLDGTTHTWEEVKAEKYNIPVERRASDAEAVVAGHILLFGGLQADATKPEDSLVFKDLYGFDPTKKEWVQFNPFWPNDLAYKKDSKEANVPTARFGHSFVGVGKNVVLFGGRCQLEDKAITTPIAISDGCDDLWVYVPHKEIQEKA